MKFERYLIAILFLILVAFTTYYVNVHILNKPEEPTSLFDAKPYQDSIRALQAKNKDLDVKICQLDSINDVLSQTRTIIRYETREKIKYVYTANPDTLVSIILTNLK